MVKSVRHHPLGPSGFECSQHRQTLRRSVDGTRSKALRPFLQALEVSDPRTKGEKMWGSGFF